MQKLLGANTFEGVAQVNPDSGAFMSSISDVDVYAGNVKGARPFSVSGAKSDISAIVYERIEQVPSIYPPFAGQALTIRSTNAADVGVQILVSMLGPNGAYIDPTVFTLNGVTPVALGQGSRINTLWRSSGDLIGDCVVEGGGNTYAAIKAGGQRNMGARYTVPTGHRLHLQSINGALSKPQGSATQAVIELVGKPAQSSVLGLLFAFSLNRDGTSSASPHQAFPGGVLGPFDLEFQALASAAGVDLMVFSSGAVFDLLSFNKP